MTLFIEDGAPVIVQGMTGHQGMTHTARMLKAGTNIVGGVNARKAGQEVNFPAAKDGEDVTLRVFGNCAEAVEVTGAQASVVFVPPRFAKDAVVEAIEAGIKLIVVITEGIPVADSAYFVELALRKDVRIVGPNCPGLLTLPSTEGVNGCNLGIIPDGIVSRGPLGLVSKSGTLTYQLMGELSDIGFTKCLGAGGDPIVGTTLQEALEAFENDDATKAVVMIGEIGGSAEQDAAKWASEHMTKPVVAYIAGFTAPEGKQMGHAGAIVSGGKGTAQFLQAVVLKQPVQQAAVQRFVPQKTVHRGLIIHTVGFEPDALRGRPLKSCARCSLPSRYDGEPEVLVEGACRSGIVHGRLCRCPWLLHCADASGYFHGRRRRQSLRLLCFLDRGGCASQPRERFQNRIHHFDDYAVAAYGFADRSYRIARQTRRNESVRMRGRNHRLGVDQCVLRQ